ncbi:hypothetical protein BDY17DRAFT_289254 [Neohortaea acidophila]|uniref:Uncharacterized protein n=1 Tax=Neohortaea acidophila TaxID=245834 RepID=A0A6A6Q694_9PEZI|nr:uncharacterized protein BDY17DRAFT_289254 [Neohortaea acidophila]KAF2487591.1 hypothetical protein BDY17DRAFT_289254 [Neohortaea acidophila]
MIFGGFRGIFSPHMAYLRSREAIQPGFRRSIHARICSQSLFKFLEPLRSDYDHRKL